MRAILLAACLVALVSTAWGGGSKPYTEWSVAEASKRFSGGIPRMRKIVFSRPGKLLLACET